MKLKEYWGVTTMFDDKGKVKAYVVSTLATQKPENTQEELKSCERYTDWFNSEKEAKAFASNAKNA